MNDAVIVSTARTPIGRAFRGALNNIKSPTLMGQAICHAVARAKIEADEVEDVIIGTVLAAGTAGMNIARHASYVAGLPVTTSSQTMDRQCASGLMAVATAAKQIIVDGMPIVVAGGQENISAVQAPYFDWVTREQDRNSVHAVAEAYMPMLQTAEFVAKKYAISREAQDLYSLESQQRTAAAQRNGGFDAEIVRINATMAEVNKQTKEVTNKNVTLAKDEGNRPDTSLGGLQKLEPVLKGGVVTAGNASQLSDGASA